MKTAGKNIASFAVAVILVLCVRQKMVGAEPLSLDQLIGDWKAIRSWDAVEWTYKEKVEGTDYRGKNPRFEKYEALVKVKPGYMVAVATVPNGSQAALQGQGFNPLYAFEFEGRGSDGELKLRNFTQDFQDRGTIRFVRSVWYFVNRLAMVGIGDDNLPIYQLAEQAYFKVDGISVEPDGLDKVGFSCPYKGAGGRVWGYMLTDRKLSSVPLFIKIQGANVGSGEWTKEIRREVYPERGKNDIPRLKKEERIERDGDKVLEKASLERIDFSEEPIPDVEFRLSHFGLPEPIGMEVKKKTPTYVWLLIGAGVFAAFGLGLGYLARRWRTGKGTPGKVDLKAK